MEEPLATYEESRFELRRRFELYPNRVRVAGRGLHVGLFDDTIPLSILNPHPGHVWVRSALFRYGLNLLFLAACLATGLGIGGGADTFARPWAVVVLGVLLWVGLMLTAAHIRRAEFVRFQTSAGIIALDIGRVGPQTDEFDEFVELLITRIAETKADAEPLSWPTDLK